MEGAEQQEKQGNGLLQTLAQNHPQIPPTRLSVKPDDLVRAQLTVYGSVLVTADAPLREIVLRAGLKCLLREEFLSL